MTNTLSEILTGRAFVAGVAQGEILATDTELSFWGGVDPATGEVIDRHHPLSGHLLEGKILALPGGRGSCSGSGVILQMLVNGRGPAAILVSRPDDIITLGVLIAQEIFEQSIPVVTVSDSDFQHVLTKKHARVADSQIICSDQELNINSEVKITSSQQLDPVKLSDPDQAILDGEKGQAAQVAMKIILQMAQLVGAKELMDVSQVHIDGCVYTGEASLTFAQELRRMGGQVAVPTTLNSISVDYRRWRDQGVPTEFGEQASALADAYTDMGARPSYTCAPYLLESAPKQGEQVAWAESNAVVFANSVLGARTMKYPDFLDACIALTGRAPCAGAHIEYNRKATLQVNLKALPHSIDDDFYPLLGYHVGQLAGNRIAAIEGIAHLHPDHDDLKAFGAAFATVSSAPMFHVVGVTPDAPNLANAMSQDETVEHIELETKDLIASWKVLNKAEGEVVDFVSLGNPHFSLSEFAKLASLCEGKSKIATIEMVITSSREIVKKATEAGYLAPIEAFGAKIVTDTCWCMIGEPVITPTARTILTNSAKYAHYGPGLTGRQFRLASLADCVNAACSGSLSYTQPNWM